MSNIIDKIQLSGVTYNIGGGGGTVSTAITSGDTNAVAGGAVYDKFDEVEQVTAQALNVLNESLSGKQDTLSAGTGIDITSNVISVTGSTGGKAIEAGRGITITTGETADTVSFNLPISAGTGSDSIVEGYSLNKASGNYSHAEGKTTKASGDKSHAEGGTTTASGAASHAEGGGTLASGYYSHAEGFDTTASGDASHAEGHNTSATSIYSHAEGFSTSASGDLSHAEGGGTKASGDMSHAEGQSTSATSANAHAEGSNTLASGYTSHAEGESTVASGNHSHAEGVNTTASGAYSHAEGRFTTAQNEAEHASGRYNVSSKANATFGDSGNTLFSVGNGSDSEYRHNVLDIRQNGDIYIVDTSASGDYFAKPMIKLQESLGGTASSAITSGDTNAVAGGAVYDKFDEVEQVTAQALNVLNDRLDEDEEVTAAALNNLNEALSGKADSSAVYLKSETSGATELATAFAATQPKLSAGTGISIDANNVISATGGGGGGTVESAITSGSTNAVQSKALWDELRLGGAGLVETTIEWSGNYSTNYPTGSTEIKLEFTSTGSTNIDFENETSGILGRLSVTYMPQWGMVSVDTSGFQGATYEISGSTFTISYPSVTNVTKLYGSIHDYATVKAIYNDPLIVLKDQVTANTAAIEAKVDTAAFNSYASSVSSALNEKLNISDYAVDSSLNVTSTNPVQNQALYSELRIGNGGETETTLVFDSNGVSTNYPSGCTRLIVEVVGNNNGSNIGFFGDWALGNIMINNWGSISVDTSGFQGATYEISGTTVIISYPTVTNVTGIQVNAYSSNYTYKAVTTEPPTVLKNQVVANTTALGGLSLVKLTQAQYDALATKDSSTLYVIVN